MKEERSVYINPQRSSEIVPLLGEALLLYDKVVIDAEIPKCFQVLAANIEEETMRKLIDRGILKFEYDDIFPIISKQTDKRPNILQLVRPKSMNEFFSNFEERVENAFKPVYPRGLIDKLKDSFIKVNIDNDILLESSYSDIQNLEYIRKIFSFVRGKFNLPVFNIRPTNNGFYLKPGEGQNELSEEVYTKATYGLHLILETNYRMALVNKFDDIICEDEYEIFFNEKLRQAFRNNKYKTKKNNFLEMCDIHDFPDVKEAISSRILKIKDIVEMREKKDGKILRVWLNKITNKSLKERNDFIKEYLKMIKTNKGLSFPTRTIILGAFQGLSLIKPIESAALSVVKEYVMPKVVNGWQPRWFFDKARKIYVKRSN